MDFIERLFGVSPDGGNGLFELLLFLIPIGGVIILQLVRRDRRRRRSNRR
jgi:hypothetical protein